MTGEPEDPGRPDNLWEPVDAGHDRGAHGTFDRRSQRHESGSSGRTCTAAGSPPWPAAAWRAWRASHS